MKCNITFSIIVLQILLSKHKFIQSITVLQKNTDNEYGKDYIGLWGPSVYMLDWLGVWTKLTKKVSINDSSYRTTGGSVIVKPYTGLQEPLTHPNSLSFIQRSELLNALDDSILESDSTKSIQYHDAVANVTRTLNGIKITTSNKQEFTADLLIAADGQHSTVRSLLYYGHHHLGYGGYNIFRGHSKRVVHKDAFQTWGVGSRFAAVPTYDGTAWFATINQPAIATNNPLKRYRIHHDSHITPQDTFNSNSNFNYLLENENAKQSDFNQLQSHFQSWHHPISELIDSTKLEDITLCNSFSTEFMTDWSSLPFLNNSQMSNGEKNLGVVFVGDARHTLDPILAHGAGKFDDFKLVQFHLFFIVCLCVCK